MGMKQYTELRGHQHARLNPPVPVKAWGKPAPVMQIGAEELNFTMKERLRPELLPPAGVKKDIRRGKRLIAENTNTLSHVDSLIWACDVDGSDGAIEQSQSAIYRSAAGLNAKAERTPIYGDLPPHCVRTFGPDGTTTWENPRGAFTRLDPRKDYDEHGDPVHH